MMADWDLLIRGGRVLDTSQGLDLTADIAVSGGSIAEIGPNLDAAQAARTIDATGMLVTAGFVDLHVHTFKSSGRGPSLDGDPTSLARGVTTALDAGTATPHEFPHFWETDIQDAELETYALMRMPDPYGPNPCTVGEAKQVYRRYDDIVVGFKFHHSQHFPALPLAREATDFTGGILMAEAYGAPLPQLLDYLNPGDILTHTFHPAFRFPLFDHRGKVHRAVWEAVERGVVLDVGHGSRGFGFRTVEQAMEQDLYPTTISTDVHSGNVDGPTFDMPTTMSKFLALGVPLDRVIEMSTVNPARALRREGGIGTLKVGTAADVVVSELVPGDYVYLDVLHEKRVGRERIVPRVVIHKGKVYDGPAYEPTEMTHPVDAPPGFIDET